MNWRKGVFLGLGSAGLCVVLSALGCSRGVERAARAETSAAAPSEPTGGPIERVVAAAPTVKTLELFTTQPARIEAFEMTPLYSKVAGYVEQVLVDIGDAVAKDQVLVQLWIPEMANEVAQKEALVAQAQAEVEQANAIRDASQAAVATAEAALAQVRAGVLRAEADARRWTSEFERVSDLASRGSLTQQVVDETRSQSEAAAASQQEAHAAVTSAQAVVKQRRADVQKCESDVRAAGARLRVAGADLERTKTLARYAQIRAPFDGVVTRRNIDTGHFVQPGGGQSLPLLEIARTDVVRIFVDVPEMEAPWIDAGEEGDRVSVAIQALSGRQIEGRVTRTSWSLDEANRSLLTEVDVPNENESLRPGMYAIATILLEARIDVLTLPATAVVRQGAEPYCMRVDGNVVHRVPVELGLRVGADQQIVSGLGPNDQVVQLRAETLADGQQVEVLPPATP